jgi:hypothetical protein
MNWAIGIIVILVGIFMVLKTQWIVSFTGPIAWAEEHLGTEGGTRMFIKLLGVLMIILTLLAATGILGDWLKGIFGPTLKM